LKLAERSGVNKPGTPQMNKVKVVGQLSVQSHNGAEYIYDPDNNNLLTEKGVVWKKDSPARQQIVNLFNKTESKVEESTEESTTPQTHTEIDYSNGVPKIVDFPTETQTLLDQIDQQTRDKVWSQLVNRRFKTYEEVVEYINQTPGGKAVQDGKDISC